MNDSPKDKSHKNLHHDANSKIHGVGRLTIDAVLAITNIVESLHKRISPISGLHSKSEEQLSGIGGLVYRNIRNVTQWVGKNIDVPLGVIDKTLASQHDSASAQSLLAALNGVLGDYLFVQENPLAIENLRLK